MYHTYVDFTNDDRPFYVGMGDDARISRKQRNRKHTNVSKKHGLNRKIIASFENREEAIQLEIKLIAEHHTFVDDPDFNQIGCNYTLGGEGCRCSKETRQKMSNIQKQLFANGYQVWNKGHIKGSKQNISEAERERRSVQLITYNLSKPMLGKQHTEETKKKLRKPKICSNCGQAGHNKLTCLVTN